MFVVGAIAAMSFEQQGNPQFTALGVDQSVSATQSGGNMEGKETRFGIAESGLFATITTDASCGAVNSMHDSFTPLGGMVPLINMQLGEVVFGGVGTGLYGMLMFAILAVFIAGLMIGRTPEYLGKKIEAHEMKMTSIAILVTPLLVLVGTAIAVMADPGRAGVANPGAHGFSEILYAFTSAANNNGSAFAGLSANTPFYNTMLGIAMWFGRFGVIVPVLAMAGSLAAKKRIAATGGTMPTHGALFVVLLVGTVLLVGAAELRARAGAGPGHRAPDALEVNWTTHLCAQRETYDMTRKTFTLFDPTLVKPAIVDSFKKLRPARAVAQPGDVRRLRRQHHHHGCCSCRPWAARARRRPASSSRSRCGCGSRCCSPTSPRRWPKAAARRRPRRCAA